MTTLFDEIKAAGIPFDNHESDLYFKVTPESDVILDKFPLLKKNSKTFRNLTDRSLWWETPFVYTPWWIEKCGRP